VAGESGSVWSAQQQHTPPVLIPHPVCDPLSHLRASAAGWAPSHPGCHCVVSGASQNNARGGKRGNARGLHLTSQE